MLRVVASVGLALSLSSCGSGGPSVEEIDKAAVCGVISPEDLKSIAQVDAVSWDQLDPTRGRRLDRLVGAGCTAELTQGEMTITVTEFEKRMGVDNGSRLRCPRVEKLSRGWICEDETSTHVMYDDPNRGIGLFFTGGAARGLSAAEAESLADRVNEGIEALDARHAD